jgi:hypothetical protein
MIFGMSFTLPSSKHVLKTSFVQLFASLVMLIGWNTQKRAPHTIGSTSSKANIYWKRRSQRQMQTQQRRGEYDRAISLDAL